LKIVLLKKSELKESIVLGIPRGGVITADIVASKLASSLSNAAVVIDFDILMPRKLPIPNNSEVAIGAIMED
jgi:predicted phosphoribosyltransferase